MKRFISLSISIALSMSLLSCSYIGTYDDGYADGYDDGYYEGSSSGYYEGIEKAKQYISVVLDDELSSVAWAIEKEYGMHPEDALLILSNYADVPDEVTEEELNKAIWVMYRYYYEANKVINGIEDYDIE